MREKEIKERKAIKRPYFIALWLMVIMAVVGCQKTEPSKMEPSNTPSVHQTAEPIEEKRVRIHFIDTGNSDAILIEQGEHAALIDGGDNNDEVLVVEYIKKLGITSLDYIFATHPDADHIGGLDAVISQIPVGQVFVGNGKATTKTYTDFIEAIMRKGLSPSVPLLGKTFNLGDATLKIVSVAHEKDVNNCSLVILYTYKDYKVLLMGDADQSIEQSIDVNEIGDVDLIKVGHHGSKTSSHYDFIKAVSPEHAVITCGEGNKYGHPNQETLDTLNKLNIATYRTDKMGDIIFDINSQGIQLYTSNPLKEDGVITQNEQKKNEILNEDKFLSENEAVVETFQEIGDSSHTVVYFTKDGKRYHKEKNCSNMKDPIVGTIDEVGERTPCKKCYN